MNTNYLPLNISVSKNELKKENLCIMNAEGQDLKNIIYSFLNYIDNFQQVAADNGASEDFLNELMSHYSIIEILYKFPVNETLTKKNRNHIRLIMKEVISNSAGYNIN